MKALVIGGGGQLGRALLTNAPADWMCVGLTRQQLDLADSAAVRRVVGEQAPDLVLNAAAYTAVDRAESDEARAFAVNAVGVGVLAEAARDCGAHLVHVSTDFVFDGAATRAYTPDHVRNPLSVYGRSKAAGEDLAGAGATVVRTAWVYGIDGANFVHTMLRLMSERDEVRVVSDQIGAPTWTTALARVLWMLGTARLPGIWHYCDAGVASWYDFAVAIQDEAVACGLLRRAIPVVPIQTSDYPTPARRPAFSLLDTGATLAGLGLPAVHWRANLRRMLDDLAAAARG